LLVFVLLFPADDDRISVDYLLSQANKIG